jgi:hypothetical protein
MQISDVTGKAGNSSQRLNQRAIEQPLLVLYSKNYSIPPSKKYEPKE